MVDSSVTSALVFVGGHCDTDRLPAHMLQADLIIAADSGQINTRLEAFLETIE